MKQKKLKEILTRDARSVLPTVTLRDAARHMAEENIGFLPVVSGDDKRVLGTVTDRDLAVKGMAKGLDPATQTVESVMSRQPVSCSEDATVDEARDLMRKHRVRRLLVSNSDHRLVGVLSLGDIATRGKEPRTAGEILEAVSATR